MWRRYGGVFWGDNQNIVELDWVMDRDLKWRGRGYRGGYEKVWERSGGVCGDLEMYGNSCMVA